ncbi:MAG TPA: acyl-CoA dehydrogenase family protein, partial [Telluria sp.]|nr:acyl-CoA dehydrogenase family protein [Telluria sp.]
ERAWRRIVTPAAKYWVCKRTLEFTGEAMEVWGGNGYVETGPMARFYREAPVNSIWEGSGNVMCLDVLRALGKAPQAAHAALAAELAPARGLDSRFDAYADRLLADLAAPGGAGGEFGARLLAERIVVAVQAALLLRHAPPFVASAFAASRLGEGVGGAFGRLPAGTDCAAILDRALAS